MLKVINKKTAIIIFICIAFAFIPVSSVVMPEVTKKVIVSVAPFFGYQGKSTNIAQTIPPKASRILLTGGQTNSSEYFSPTAITTHGSLIYIADSTKKKIHIMDKTNNTVVNTIDLAESPSGLAVSNDGATLYVTAGGYEGKVFVINTLTRAIAATYTAAHTPMSPVLSADGTKLFICNRFSNNVQIYNTSSGSLQSTIAVTREPMSIVLVGNKLYITGQLTQAAATDSVVATEVSVINTDSSALIKTISLQNGAIDAKCIAASPDGAYVYITHVLAKYTTTTTQLTRGWINTNAIAVIKTATDELDATVLLDELDLGAANPWGIVATTEKIYVTTSGTNELLTIDRVQMHNKINSVVNGTLKIVGKLESRTDICNDLTFLNSLRIRTKLAGIGARNIYIDNDNLYIAEYFSGTISIINRTSLSISNIPIGVQAASNNTRKGEILWNDASICYQQWQSCASCHPDARNDGLNWDNMNDGIGSPKQSKSMLLSTLTPPTMITGIRADTDMGVKAGVKFILFNADFEQTAFYIEEYLASLVPEKSPYLVNGQLSESAQRGKTIFEGSAGCVTCHPSPLYTDMNNHLVGTNVGNETRPFDTPTLVESWRTAPYLYDGRAKTMRDVLTTYNVSDKHGITSNLSSLQIDDLANYTLSISDIPSGPLDSVSAEVKSTIYNGFVSTGDLTLNAKIVPAYADLSLTDTFLWELTSGDSTKITIQNPAIQAPVIQIAGRGTYVFRVTVKGKSGEIRTNQVSVNAEELISSVTIVKPQGIYAANTTVQLGCIINPTQTAIAKYEWTILNPIASISFNNGSIESPTLTSTENGNYTIKLSVTDIYGKTVTQTASVQFIFSISAAQINPQGHTLLVSGSGYNRIAVIGKYGETIWELPNNGLWQEANDSQMLPDGKIVYAYHFYGGNSGVRLIIPNYQTGGYQTVFDRVTSSGGETHSCQPISNGFLIGESYSGYFNIIEINMSGNTTKTIKILKPAVSDPHALLREIRKTEQGTYLIPLLSEGSNKTYEYDSNGNLIKTFPVPGFTANRLPNGNTLIGTGSDGRFVEYSADGTLVWAIGKNELTNNSIGFAASVTRLSNGNTIICNWGGHGGNGTSTVMEVDQNKGIVWTLGVADNASISAVQILDDFGLDFLNNYRANEDIQLSANNTPYETIPQTYNWTVIGAPNGVTLSDLSISNPKLRAMYQGNYQIKLTIKDITGKSVSTTRTIKVVTTGPKILSPSSTPIINRADLTIGKINPKTSIDIFRTGLTASSGTIRIFSGTGIETANGYIGTGFSVRLYSGADIIDELQPVIFGDVDGNGDIDIADLSTIKRHLLKIQTLTGKYLFAGDITKKGTVTISDMLTIKKNLLGIGTISQS